MSVRLVNVTIAGQAIGLRTDASDEDLDRYVRAVDDTLHAVTGGKPPSMNAVLLTALALAQRAEEADAKVRDAAEEVERLRALVTGHAQGALAFLDEDAADA